LNACLFVNECFKFDMRNNIQNWPWYNLSIFLVILITSITISVTLFIYHYQFR
jgi:hypothetical protein